MQERSALAVYLQETNADGQTFSEKPFGPSNCLVERGRLAFECDRAVIPSLSPSELMRVEEVAHGELSSYAPV